MTLNCLPPEGSAASVTKGQWRLDLRNPTLVLGGAHGTKEGQCAYVCVRVCIYTHMFKSI